MEQDTEGGKTIEVSCMIGRHVKPLRHDSETQKLAARPWKSKWQDTKRLNWTLKALATDMSKAYHSTVNSTNHLKRVHTDLLKLFPKDKRGITSCPTRWDLNYQHQTKESHRPITLRDIEAKSKSVFIIYHVGFIPEMRTWFYVRKFM